MKLTPRGMTTSVISKWSNIGLLLAWSIYQSNYLYNARVQYMGWYAGISFLYDSIVVTNFSWAKHSVFVSLGECGAGLGEYLGSEHHEHGEGPWLPPGRWTGRTVGTFQIHGLLAVCRWARVPGAQSYSGRYVVNTQIHTLACTLFTYAEIWSYTTLNKIISDFNWYGLAD